MHEATLALQIVTVVIVARLWMIYRPMPGSVKEFERHNPTIKKSGPFGKPNLRRVPKVNDDLAAWKKENDLD